jgi:hypothetical protein
MGVRMLNPYRVYKPFYATRRRQQYMPYGQGGWIIAASLFFLPTVQLSNCQLSNCPASTLQNPAFK